ncbi:lipid-binding serum glycoprotein family protein [Rhynchospora pubera]|uniref:Lipid-binding serum glycoprotein family protein n=1 Tax=Rhynchospora pubera TaxID=906938 RepID=A0AAV8H4V1_9POAL|nr:lipid-binding serum glycoprotein family protein [Rhynchospora pubera]
MASLLLFLLVSASLLPQLSNSESDSYISATISTKGLSFAKDLIISQAVDSFVPIRIPDIKKSVRIPLVGEVHMTVSNVTIEAVNVSASDSTAAAGESGIVIVASGASAKLSLKWSYWYDSWFVTVSDEGIASVQVEGMELGLTVGMKNENGALKTFVSESGCYINDLDITMDGGASWFYQIFVDGFQDHIKASVESAITAKITEGAEKLDSLLQSLPKEVNLDDVAFMNVTFVNDPLFKNSAVEFNINGLFVSSERADLHNDHKILAENSVFLSEGSKMLWISLDEAVFNSASDVLFQAGMMHWVVNTIPEQFFLNTKTWRFLIPKLYKKYPNEDMALNISVTSSPLVKIGVGNIGATVNSDMLINVLDGNQTVPVACIAVEATVSGSVGVEGNKIVAKSELDDFSLALKWSNIGNFHMSLIRGAVRIFLKSICIPYLNSYLRHGIPLPIIHGFTLEDAYILMPNSRVIVGADVTYNRSIAAPEIRSFVYSSNY